MAKQSETLGEPNVGEVVTLKSGGEPMTVKSVENGEAECAWFDQYKALRKEKFPIAVLTKFVPKG